MEFIPLSQSAGILEHNLSGLEIDAVLSEVELVLAFVVFESHSDLSVVSIVLQCTYRCQY